MRLDKRTIVIGAAAVAATVVLGYLAGALAGVLTALAGVVFAVLWQVAASRQVKVQAERDLLTGAERAFELPPWELRSPAGYLRPEAEMVTFRHRRELDDLRDWLTSAAHAGVSLVTGQAGSGKTRLARQLAADAREEFGWRVYWVPPGGEEQAAGAARHGDSPVLLIADYAETRDDLGSLLAVISEGDGPSVRVLLLARSAGEWWQLLVTETDVPLSDTLAAVQPVSLGPLTSPAGQEEVFRQALADFAAELGTACPAAGLPPVGPDAVVLIVHAAALLAVLDHAAGTAGDANPQGADGVIDRLLGHEARYWQHSQNRYSLGLSPVILERAVAAGALVGADSEPAAAALLAAIGDLADPAVRGKTARWLHDLYPVPAGSAGSEWIGRLQPDLVAEKHVVRVLCDRQDLARALLTGLDPQRAAGALTILARAALTDPDAAGLISLALRSDPDGLVIPAMTVAIETNPAVGDQIAAAMTGSRWKPGLLEQIAQALPDTSVALAATAAQTYQHLADTAADDEQRAPRLGNLSTWLSRLGRREDALAAIGRAVAAYTDLAAARPDAFLPDLAMSLDNQSLRLADLGRREDALAAIDRAVAIRRELAAALPGVFLGPLRNSLAAMARLLTSLGMDDRAAEAASEAERYPAPT